MTKKEASPILTPNAMAAVDRAAAETGIDSYGLMIKAGWAVAATALRSHPGAIRFVVLAGPGNNGGDGYVAARALVESGAAVVLFHLGEQGRLRGDAARACADCPVRGAPLDDYHPRAGDVVIDGLFGAGLDRAVPESVAAIIGKVGALGLPVIAADLPSGLCGRTGQVLGAAFQATHTVTFMTPKPGHLLLPGRALCGALEVFDIGIPMRLVEAQAENLFENGPALWQNWLPRLGAESHKFRRGHLGVFSGGATATGAARLSAMAGLKAGAGLVTIAAPHAALAANAAHLTAVMLREIDDLAGLQQWATDPRLTAFVLGPGFGVGERARDFVLALSDRSLVLDADGITSFSGETDLLFSAFVTGEPHLVLTPHEGEFARLFPDIAADGVMSKVDKARAAAQRANAAIIYKGADTVIAAPDGRAAINTNAPPSLATAGSGDVLAGIAGGLMAQGLPAFEAAAAAVWIHGDAGNRAGRGLTAEDLLTAIHLPA
ncbi:NAD(P)H-hydrate dehydratase [Allorhizobium borbori]|uniref:Bifunctional NAD(P)H-hydrate repair enzyme n=1 Tax=Allorhizobium borbori TaxID=485907 RepID=A0A7W6JZB9_9HYPH|nr:NAD(P)H-hydrate dehydratase [Allorhizobium borbori]MBB4102314.1 NAD(P)H-hydrate epimerase [Allorhizobium borbori]